MIELLTLVSVVLTYIWARLLHLLSPAERPKVFFKSPCSPFIQSLLKSCPILNTVYWPTYLWGRSGHFQTIVHAKMGRIKPKWPDSQRCHHTMPDGATMSYDLFAPHEEKSKEKGRFTLALCPGIANSSESIYLRTFSSYAQSHGYRVAVLNHIGALKSETLTSPRIFTYGHTEELDMMINQLMELYPDSKIVLVGFSMGGNIVTKYLGECSTHQKKVLCGMSICQGYDVNEAKEYFLEWTQLRRVYTYVITRVQRRLLNRHHSLLFSDEMKKRCGPGFDEKRVFSATSLAAIDASYSCHRAGFKNLYEYYKWCSSAYYLHNIKIPMLYMNAQDDPLCPVSLLKYPREEVEKNENSIYVETKHGGHLGYFEGGIIIPNEITWLDRVIIEYADAITSLYLHGNLPAEAVSNCLEDLNSITNNMEKKNTIRKKRKIATENDMITNSLDNYANVSDNMMKVHGRPGEDGRRSDESSILKDDSHMHNEDKEKNGSLKRGSILQQATSYVQ